MKKVRLVLLALAVGSMSIFTACGNGATEEGTEQANGEATEVVEENATEEVTEQEAPAEEQTVTEEAATDSTATEATEGTEETPAE